MPVCVAQRTTGVGGLGVVGLRRPPATSSRASASSFWTVQFRLRDRERAARVAVDGEHEHRLLAQVDAIAALGGCRDPVAHHRREPRGLGPARVVLGDRAPHEQVVDLLAPGEQRGRARRIVLGRSIMSASAARA